MTKLPPRVLIGGGTGFIGQALTGTLKSKGYSVTVISRKPGPSHTTWGEIEKKGIPADCTAVVNLAGQNIFDMTRRWTPGFKQNVYSSRVYTTKMLSDAIEKAQKDSKPKVFISMSGVGYYKPDSQKEYTEDSPGGDFDFLSELVTDWESAAKAKDTRNVILRSGVVLGREGGVVNQMYYPFYLGLGGPVGSGSQYFPWIHITDIVGLIIHALEKPSVTGVLNAVSPQVITNKQFAKALGKAMWRPALIPMPSFVLDFAFSSERAKIMTEGQKVIPKKTLETGYTYKYPDIDSACKQCARFIYADDQLLHNNP